jgi:hypothetical protein
MISICKVACGLIALFVAVTVAVAVGAGCGRPIIFNATSKEEALPELAAGVAAAEHASAAYRFEQQRAAIWRYSRHDRPGRVCRITHAGDNR